MSEKIQPHHLQRLAITYGRQSSATQIRTNRESARRQRALEQRARQLGWPAERIVVLQEEQARSGSSTHGRDAYRQIAELVAKGRAGIIVAVDVARWARDTVAWQLLLRDCLLESVLLADEHTVYDPRDPHDRVLLGIQGALAEYELSVLRERMLTCWWEKARRAEVFTSVPPGYMHVGDQGLEKHPHRRVQKTISLVFEKFQNMPSAYALCRWLRKQDHLLPFVSHGDDPHNVQWVAPTYKRVLWMLKNPTYTGAYVLGRTKTILKRNDAGETVRHRIAVPPDQWEVVEKERFPAYISWQQYQDNVAKIQRNATVQGNPSQPAAARGASLLSGLLRCRRCGHRLIVQYGRTGMPRHVCQGGRPQRDRGRSCLSFSGRHVEPLFSQTLLEAVSPAGVEAARQAAELMRRDGECERQALRDQLEQLRYEAQRAQRQYDRIEPENRLVAAELECRWNQALAALATQQARLNAFEDRQQETPTAEQVRQLQSLGQRLDHVWHHPQADPLIKKQIARWLVREVVVEVDEARQEISLIIHWAGGLHTELRAPRRRHRRNSAAECKAVIAALRAVGDDLAIAHALNRNGLRHPSGTWTAGRVRSFRQKHGIAAFDPTVKKATGVLSQDEAAQTLKISPMSVHRLVQSGILPAEQPAPGFPCILRTADLSRPEVKQAVHRIQTHLPRPLPEDPDQLKLF